MCVFFKKKKNTGIQNLRQLWLGFPLCIGSQLLETKVHLYFILHLDVKGRARIIWLKETVF